MAKEQANLNPVFQTLAKRKPALFTASIPPLAENPAARRGFYDRRAFALREISADNLIRARPVSPQAALIFEACLDVLGEVLFIENGHGWDGVQQNILAARQRMADPDAETITSYDNEAYLIASAAFRSLTPKFAEMTPELDSVLIEERIERAAAKTLGHSLLEKRLRENKDIINTLLHEARDLNALVWFLSRQVRDRPTNEDVDYYLTLSGTFVSADEKLTGLHARLADLYDTKRKLEETSGTVTLIRDQMEQLLAKERDKRLNELMVDRKRDNARRAYKAAKKALRRFQAETKKLARHPLGEREKRSALKRTNDRIEKTNEEIGELQETRAEKIEKTLAKWSDGHLEPAAKEREPKMQSGMRKTSDAPSLDYYKINTLEYDKVSNAADLVTDVEADTILNGLFVDFAKELRHVNREARNLAQYLRAAFQISIERQREEGIFDPLELPQMIIDPHHPLPYMALHETQHDSFDTLVTLLLDNSYSMLGQNKIQMAYLAGERLSFWLSGLGIKTEILGFTTRRIDPETRAKKRATIRGRADALHHIVYKEMLKPHTRQMTHHMAAMLKQDNMLATVLGEAVLWAYARLIKAPQRRKILMVLSDGLPSFSYVGDQGIPDKHLGDVVHFIEGGRACEIIGIGIQNDLSKFFARSIKLSTPEDLARVMAQSLREIIIPPRGKAPRMFTATQSRSAKPVPA